MKHFHFAFITLLFAAVFTLLFYKNSTGINLLIFEWIAIPLMAYLHKPVKFSRLNITLLTALCISSVMVIAINSVWTLFVNFLLLVSVSGCFVFKNFKSYIHLSLEVFIRLFSTHFSRQNYKTGSKSKTEASTLLFKTFLFVVIPVFIAFIFLQIYSSASSRFAGMVEPIFNFFDTLLQNVDLSIVFVFLLGIFVANVLLRKSKSKGLLEIDVKASDNLLRTKQKHHIPFRKKGLKDKNITGITTLLLLNILILAFNFVDVRNVWFFTWDGSFLKEFVHEGTWLLIFSIFLSMFVSLYFFSGNMNFFSRNKLLKYLSIIWIAQNIFMTLSVLIRNIWYISFFGLAYKRIFLLFFLALVILGLITIIIKIWKCKTAYYLLKINSYAMITAIAVSSFVDWNIVIAKYNFANSHRSFVEYAFMADLTPSALPYTIKSKEELKTIDSLQIKNMPFDTKRHYFMTGEDYYAKMQQQKDHFLNQYAKQKPLEWNLADYLTYKRLMKHQN